MNTGFKLAYCGCLIMGTLAIFNDSVIMAILTGSTLIAIGLLEISNAIKAPRYKL